MFPFLNHLPDASYVDPCFLPTMPSFLDSDMTAAFSTFPAAPHGIPLRSTYDFSSGSSTDFACTAAHQNPRPYEASASAAGAGPPLPAGLFDVRPEDLGADEVSLYSLSTASLGGGDYLGMAAQDMVAQAGRASSATLAATSTELQRALAASSAAFCDAPLPASFPHSCAVLPTESCIGPSLLGANQSWIDEFLNTLPPPTMQDQLLPLDTSPLTTPPQPPLCPPQLPSSAPTSSFSMDNLAALLFPPTYPPLYPTDPTSAFPELYAPLLHPQQTLPPSQVPALNPYQCVPGAPSACLPYLSCQATTTTDGSSQACSEAYFDSSCGASTTGASDLNVSDLLHAAALHAVQVPEVPLPPLMKQGLAKSLPQVWHLPISEASKQLSIGVTQLKKLCRSMGVPKWPARKLRSLDSLIAVVEQLVAEGEGDERSSAMNALQELRVERELMGRDPTRRFNERFLKLRQSYFKLVHMERRMQGCAAGYKSRASSLEGAEAKRSRTAE